MWGLGDIDLYQKQKSYPFALENMFLSFDIQGFLYEISVMA